MKHALASVMFGLAGVVACGGGGGGHAVDAPEQVIDAPDHAGDAPPATGTATIQLQGTAIAGQLVEWYDASGAVIADGTTDANGLAHATVGANAAVTLATGGLLYTTLGIQPGDTIVIAAPPAVTQVFRHDPGHRARAARRDLVRGADRRRAVAHRRQRGDREGPRARQPRRRRVARTTCSRSRSMRRGSRWGTPRTSGSRRRRTARRSRTRCRRSRRICDRRSSP